MVFLVSPRGLVIYPITPTYPKNQNYTAPSGKILHGKIAELLKFNIDVKNLTVANKQTNKHKFNIDSPRGQPLTPYPKWPKNKKITCNIFYFPPWGVFSDHN